MTDGGLWFPFMLSEEELRKNMDAAVDAVWGSLRSDFITLPKGTGFVPYEQFASAYEVLRRTTKGFADWKLDTVMTAFGQDQLVFVVVRTMLGLTPPEWAYLASSEKDAVRVSQGQSRTFDRAVRDQEIKMSAATRKRVTQMLATAVTLIAQKVPAVREDSIHRLDKIDTKDGVNSVRYVAEIGVPYPMLLYERFLGRPFASHRDAVSDLVGDVMEVAVEDILSAAGVVHRKTKRVERIPGFEQAPDFFIPDELTPAVLIEAKICEDDGTARDKVARIKVLANMRDQRRAEGKPSFQVVACIGGRGFGVRKQDMRDLIHVTEGKVFTLSTLDKLVDHTDIARFRTKP